MLERIGKLVQFSVTLAALIIVTVHLVASQNPLADRLFGWHTTVIFMSLCVCLFVRYRLPETRGSLLQFFLVPLVMLAVQDHIFTAWFLVFYHTAYQWPYLGGWTLAIFSILVTSLALGAWRLFDWRWMLGAILVACGVMALWAYAGFPFSDIPFNGGTIYSQAFVPNLFTVIYFSAWFLCSILAFVRSPVFIKERVDSESSCGL